MSCPTCDHTMQVLCVDGGHGHATVFWCPRCGTTKVQDRDDELNIVGVTSYSPMLVERVQALSDRWAEDDMHKRDMHTLGIRESIQK